jgi:hypothetical protein
MDLHDLVGAEVAIVKRGADEPIVGRLTAVSETEATILGRTSCHWIVKGERIPDLRPNNPFRRQWIVPLEDVFSCQRADATAVR